MQADKLKIAILLAGYLLVIGCTSTPEIPIPTSTAEPTKPISTDTITPSPTATKTPTLTPQSTVLPAITPYPTPETPLDADGAWLIFPAALTNPEKRYAPPHLWAMNADGTGLTLLDTDAVLTYALRPDNTQDSRLTLIYITYKANDYSDLTLKSITLPDLEKTTITPLIGPDGVDHSYDLPVAFIYRWYLWSSDGNTLAFIGLMDGQYPDIYTYNFTTKTITRLTSDAPIDYDESDEERAFWDQGYACCLKWSPDERYVIYEPYFGNLVGERWLPGLAAARVDGGRAIRMLDIAANFEVFGWYSPNEILLQDKGLTDDEQPSGIYAFKLDTGESTIIIDEAVYLAAYAEEYDTWLYTSGRDQPLILYRDGVATEVVDNPGTTYFLSWSDEDNAFRGGGYIITPDGHVSQIVRTPGPTLTPPLWMGEFEPEQKESPDGSLWAWIDRCYTVGPYMDTSCGLWVGTPDSVPSEIFTSPEENYGKLDNIVLYRVIWSPDSQRLIYLTDHGVFMAKRPDFEPVLIAEIYGGNWIGGHMIWVEK